MHLRHLETKIKWCYYGAFLKGITVYMNNKIKHAMVLRSIYNKKNTSFEIQVINKYLIKKQI